MYFCNCRGITESEITDAIANGARTYKAAFHACAVDKPVCGLCRTDFEPLLARQDQKSTPSIPVAP